MQITIHGKQYTVNEDEYPLENRPDINPLQVKRNVGYEDREISLLKEISIAMGIKYILICGDIKSGYIPIELLPYYDTIELQSSCISTVNLFENIKRYDTHNKIKIPPYPQPYILPSSYVLKNDPFDWYEQGFRPSVVLTTTNAIIYI